jgi:hypothetical protein
MKTMPFNLGFVVTFWMIRFWISLPRWGSILTVSGVLFGPWVLSFLLCGLRYGSRSNEFRSQPAGLLRQRCSLMGKPDEIGGARFRCSLCSRGHAVMVWNLLRVMGYLGNHSTDSSAISPSLSLPGPDRDRFVEQSRGYQVKIRDADSSPVQPTKL